MFSKAVNYPIHFLSSFSLFLSFFPILLLTNSFLFSHPKFSKWISVFGFILSVVDFVFLLTAIEGGKLFSYTAFLEWLSLFGYIGWGTFIGLVSLFYFRKSSPSSV